mgnify:CR=1 FL=1
MKIEFSKDGVTINSKKIDPLNIKVEGIELISNMDRNKKDPLEILEALAAIKKDKGKREKFKEAFISKERK